MTTDHTDLIARAEAYVKPRPGLPTDSPNYDIVRKLLAALADSVPQMTADQFREAVGLERASHAARGYDEAHDRAHGVVHLLGWAIDYAARGEAVKSGSLIVAALSVSGDLEREERALRAERDALAHVIDEARRIVGTADLREFIDEAPAVSLARHDAEVWDAGFVRGVDFESAQQVQAINPYRAAAIRAEAAPVLDHAVDNASRWDDPTDDAGAEHHDDVEPTDARQDAMVADESR